MMTKDEVKLQCVSLACSILGVYGGATAYTSNGESNKPSMEDMLTEAKKLYKWIAENSTLTTDALFEAAQRKLSDNAKLLEELKTEATRVIAKIST